MEGPYIEAMPSPDSRVQLLPPPKDCGYIAKMTVDYRYPNTTTDQAQYTLEKQEKLLGAISDGALT